MTRSATVPEHRPGWIRQSLPLLLLTLCPPFAIVLWHTHVHLDGSLLRLWELIAAQGPLAALGGILRPVWWGSATAWQILGIFAASQLLLMRLLPGRRVYGTITPEGHVPEYRANGVPAFLISVALFLGCSYGLGWFSAGVVYDHFGALLGASNVFSLCFCLLLYFKGRFRPSSRDHGHTGNPIFDYYWGTELFPRIGGWDVKQFTNCRFGMMGWPLILLSFAAKQHELHGLTDAMIVSVAIQLVYIFKFFVWEPGYLRSMDIQHDRAGFYICWGCLVWLPSVYTSHTLYLVNHPHTLGWPLAGFFLLAGLACVALNYWADYQRQVVRATDGKTRIWGREPRLIHATYVTGQGEVKQSILLASGWWGVSRHFHYVPEIGLAFFWSVPALFDHVLPYFYVVFLTILLTHRSVRDDRRCAEKYGTHWEEYRRLVPNRILPRLFGVPDEEEEDAAEEAEELTGEPA
jgi:7-dehydrocholesterol reductase